MSASDRVAADLGEDGARGLLSLEMVSPTRFRSRHAQANHARTLFGGQALAEALHAAAQTGPDWPAHHLAGYFLRAGAIDRPVDYDVAILRDGRRFASRRVTASQEGRLIFEMLCAFHDPEPGLAHQREPWARLPDPERLPSLADYVQAHADRLPPEVVQTYGLPFPVELRLAEPERVFFDRLEAPARNFWFRVAGAQALSDGLAQQCLLAFASDYWLAGVAAGPHRPPLTADGFTISSLNHNLWFHAPVRAGEWLQYVTESPWAGTGRGLARGLIYDRVGTLVASAAQEALMRLPRG